MSINHSGSSYDFQGLIGDPQPEPEVKRAVLAYLASDAFIGQTQSPRRPRPNLSRRIPAEDIRDVTKNPDTPSRR